MCLHLSVSHSVPGEGGLGCMVGACVAGGMHAIGLEHEWQWVWMAGGMYISGSAWQRWGMSCGKVCIAGVGVVWQGGLRDRGACVTGGLRDRGGACVTGGGGGLCDRGFACKRDGYWSGRYAFYWNAFLLFYILTLYWKSHVFHCSSSTLFWYKMTSQISWFSAKYKTSVWMFLMVMSC